MSTVQERAIVPFDKVAALCAILVGIGGFAYSVAFIILVIAEIAPGLGLVLSSLFLMLIGLLSTVVLIAIYSRLRERDTNLALLALVLGIASAVGSAVHGGYDLANAINPPEVAASDLPSQINPRGLLSFAVSGIALSIIAWLIWFGRQLPIGLAYLGGVSAILLVIIYLGRLLVLDPTNPVILIPALLNGFLVNPAWYIWVGGALWIRKKQ